MKRAGRLTRDKVPGARFVFQTDTVHTDAFRRSTYGVRSRELTGVTETPTKRTHDVRLTLTVKIEPVGCPPFANTTTVTDSLLNDRFVQDVLKELAAQAGWSKAFRDQVEYGLFVMRNSKTGTDTVVLYDNQIADRSGNLYTLPPGPCLSSTTLRDLTTLAQNGYVPVLQMHVHPKHGSSEFWVSNCYYPDAGQKPPYLPRQADYNSMLELPHGPSRWDTDPWKKGPDSPQWPGYVIEPNRVYQWDAPLPTFKYTHGDWALQACVGGDR